MFELKPIISTLLRHRSTTLLIILQVAITFAVVVNAMSIITQRLALMDRQSGIVEEELISFTVSPFAGFDSLRQQIDADELMLRQIPGVIDATVVTQVPFQNSGSSAPFASSQKNYDDKIKYNAGVYSGSHHFINTLGLKLVMGRDFNEEEVVYSSENTWPGIAIITQSLADKLYPDTEAIGQTIHYGVGDARIIGVVDHLAGTWPSSKAFKDNVIFPKVRLIAYMHFIVRVEPSLRESVLGKVEKLMFEQNPNRLIYNVRSMTELKTLAYNDDISMSNILWVIIGLLIVITAFGIVGIVQFNVKRRTKQIGTRRALGARKVDILRYFVTEIIIITSIGLLLGCLISISVNIYLVNVFGLTPFEWYFLVIGIALMFIISLIAVWLPSQRAANVSPAVATQSI